MMKSIEFSRETPLGLGWLFGHVDTESAVRAAAEHFGVSESEIRSRYEIGKES